MSKKEKKTQTHQTQTLKSAYRAFLVQSNLKRFRVGCFLGATLVPLGSIFDYFIYPDHFAPFLIMRMVFAGLYAACYFLSYSEFAKRHVFGLIVLLTQLIAIPIVMMIMATGGYESPYYAGLNLIILGVAMLFTWRHYEALIVCCLIYVTYLAPIFIFNEITDFHTFFNNNYFISFTIIIAVVSNHFASKLRRSDFYSRYKLRDAVKELSQLDKAKTNFFSGVSHELRTPLTLILAPIEHMLKQKHLDPETEDRLKVCHGNALRLLKLINNLLDVIRINTGRMELRYSKKDLTCLLSEVIKNVSPLAEKKKITIDFAKEGENFYFFWDEDQLEKVVVNLVYNALKFTPDKGNIHIACTDKGSSVQVLVQDSGIGIPEDQVNKIFDPFYQVDSGSNRSYEGSGMGLALCKQIVELHGGDIWAESEKGTGTKMFFEIPKKLQLEETQVPLEEQEVDWTKQVSKEATYEQSKLKKVKTTPAPMPKIQKEEFLGTVLVVEDNMEMQDFICTELNKHFTVFRAENGQEGLAVAKEEKPDLILSDVMMPVMDGYEMCRRLKKNESTKHIPVLMLTAKTEIDMRLSGYDVGADDYVAKPFNMQELLAKSKALIQGRRLEREMELYRRLASVGELAAGVAHEINNALNVSVLANARLKKLIKNQEGEKQLGMDQFLNESEKGIHLLDEGLSRANRVVQSLLTFSKKNSEGFQFQNVHEGIRSTLTMLENEIKDRVQIHENFEADKEIYCDLNQLNQVFLNIIKNALEAIPGKGNVTIHTWIEKEQLMISIKDDGPGIDKEDVARIFDPFFTTKPVGKGTGLGLSVSYNIVLEHGGSLVCKSQPGEGTEFIITLPTQNKDKTQIEEQAG